MSDCWHVGYFCVFAEVGAGVGEWGVCFLVFGESNLAIRHCGNFKFSYSDFPHSWIKGVNLHPVDNPLKPGMTTPVRWDVNSRNPG